jgi:protein TonB
MMNVLLESRPRKQRKVGGTLFSVAVHSAIVFFAVYATARAGIPEVRENREQKVTFVKPKAAPAKQPEAAPPPKAQPKPKVKPKVVPAPTLVPPKGFKVIEAPVIVPTEIPAIDPTAQITNEADFKPTGVPGGTGSGEGTGIDTERSYNPFEVEREVMPLSGTKVDYPERARSSGAEGKVFAQFVVNEKGRVETSTFKVLESTSAVFTQAVQNALPRMRFRPAQIGNISVSQVVQQAFVFKLDR